MNAADPLPDAKHEAFAQMVARGASAGAAYRAVCGRVVSLTAATSSGQRWGRKFQDRVTYLQAEAQADVVTPTPTPEGVLAGMRRLSAALRQLEPFSLPDPGERARYATTVSNHAQRVLAVEAAQPRDERQTPKSASVHLPPVEEGFCDCG